MTGREYNKPFGTHAHNCTSGRSNEDDAFLCQLCREACVLTQEPVPGTPFGKETEKLRKGVSYPGCTASCRELARVGYGKLEHTWAPVRWHTSIILSMHSWRNGYGLYVCSRIYTHNSLKIERAQCRTPRRPERRCVSANSKFEGKIHYLFNV